MSVPCEHLRPPCAPPRAQYALMVYNAVCYQCGGAQCRFPNPNGQQTNRHYQMYNLPAIDAVDN